MSHDKRSEMIPNDPVPGEARADRPISVEIENAFRAVPQIGQAWRWYDIPYRGLSAAFWNRRYWSRLPAGLRKQIDRLRNRLWLANQIDRERVMHKDHPLWNLKVPEGERISLPVFWMIEYYSPSHVGELTRRFQKGVWRKGGVGQSFDLPEQSIASGRESEDPLSWHRVATLVPVAAEGFYLPGTIRAHIPSEFRAISVALMPLGSSLTSVVAEFSLTDEATLALDRALRVEREPAFVRRNGRTHISPRSNVAISAVQAERKRLHDAGRAWFARELPGLFARDGQSSHPAMDLLITRKYNPMNTRYIPAEKHFGE